MNDKHTFNDHNPISICNNNYNKNSQNNNINIARCEFIFLTIWFIDMSDSHAALKFSFGRGIGIFVLATAIAFLALVNFGGAYVSWYDRDWAMAQITLWNYKICDRWHFVEQNLLRNDCK